MATGTGPWGMDVARHSLPDAASWVAARLRGGAISWVTFLLVLLAVVPPLVIVAHTSIQGTHGVSMAGFAAIFASRTFWVSAGYTVAFAVGASVCGLVVGVPVAWIIERTPTRLARAVYVTAFISFAFPGIVKAAAWVFLAGPRAGFVNELLRALHFPGDINIFTFGGMIFVEGLFWAPVVVQLIGISFQLLNPDLEDSAAASGASLWSRIRSVTLPLALPSILGVSLLMLLWCLQTFEVPLILGVPARMNLLSISIYDSVNESVPPNYQRAAASAMVIVVVVMAALFLYRYLIRQSERFASVGGRGYRARHVDVGRWQWLADGLCVVFIVVELIAPAYLFFFSFTPGFGIQYGAGGLGVANYVQVFRNPALVRAAANSFLVAGVTAVGTVLLGFLVAWTVHRSEFALKGLVDYIANLPLALTSVVLGLAVLLLTLTLPLGIYGTIWAMVLAYVIAFLPYSLRYASTGLLQIGRELDDAASTSGAGPIRVFRSILLPLLGPALVGVGAFVFLISVRELAVSALLYTPNSEVLSTLLLDMWTNGNTNQVSSLATLISVVSVLMGWAALVLVRPNEVRR